MGGDCLNISCVSSKALLAAAKAKINTIASLIVPDLACSDISKYFAGNFFTKTLFYSTTRKLVKFLQKF